MITQGLWRLRTLELENVREFVSLRLDFGDPRAAAGRRASSRQRATVFIGQNETNKSTLLRALALGVASQREASVAGIYAAPAVGTAGREPFS